MLNLLRLKIDRYRGVQPGLELHFHEGFNIVLGQNGTGKTTLLNLISMILRSDFSSLAEEEFAFEFELSWKRGRSVIRFSNRSHPGTQRPLPPEVRSIATARPFRPNLEASFHLLSSDKTTRVAYDGAWHFDGQVDPEVLNISETCFDPQFWYGLYSVGGEELRMALPFSMEASSYRFDESLDLFRETIGRATYPGVYLFSEDKGQRFIVPVRAGLMEVPLPLRRAMEVSFQGNASEILVGDTDFLFLREVAHLMGFASAQARIEILERSLRGRRLRLGNLAFRFTRDNGDVITHELLSYGQKRMLMFYYYLALNESVIIADELVNGLHHQWIAACVKAIGARQAFLTSQNPLLLDYLPFSSKEQVLRSFILCKCTKQEDQLLLSWSNMNPEDASEFFAAYQVGIEHVSEILQSRGLW